MVIILWLCVTLFVWSIHNGQEVKYCSHHLQTCAHLGPGEGSDCKPTLFEATGTKVHYNKEHYNILDISHAKHVSPNNGVNN